MPSKAELAVEVERHQAEQTPTTTSTPPWAESKATAPKLDPEFEKVQLMAQDVCQVTPTNNPDHRIVLVPIRVNLKSKTLSESKKTIVLGGVNGVIPDLYGVRLSASITRSPSK